MKRLVLKTIVAAVAFAAFGIASAQERTIKFTTQNPEGHPLVMGMHKFADLVAAKSGGKIKVNLFPGGVLGGDGPVISAMQGGTIEMASMNTSYLAGQVKEFAVFDFPFMFSNSKEADAVVDGPFGKQMHAKLDAKGLIGLTYWELGFRNITNNKRAIVKVEDIAGLKLRVIPTPINVDWVKTLGANPTPMTFGEVYSALEQGAIDGQENPLTVIAANKLFEVQKYLTLTNHQYNPQSVLISKKFWDTLSPAEKKIISDAAAESTVYQRQQARAQATTALEAVKKGGMQVTELAPAEVDKLREKMRPVVAKFAVSVGQETVKGLQDALAQARASK
ncbi:TRAP transporter substrate-binding protein [Polaromonas hydrogenivorans]|uniref:TRAP transporter substrate-binding protein n=1 Tax=Polaromonas hydrogenivorans TaxID=335476 RepID=A0AAU7LP41_9BURK